MPAWLIRAYAVCARCTSATPATRRRPRPCGSSGRHLRLGDKLDDASPFRHGEYPRADVGVSSEMTANQLLRMPAVVAEDVI